MRGRLPSGWGLRVLNSNFAVGALNYSGHTETIREQEEAFPADAFHPPWYVGGGSRARTRATDAYLREAHEAARRNLEASKVATNIEEAQPAPNQREAAEAVQAAAARKREAAVAAAVQEREAADAVLEREDPIGQVPVLGLNLAAGGAGTRPGDSSGPEVRHEGTADLKFVLGDPVRLEELSSDAIGRQVAVKWLAPDRKGSTWHQGTVQAYHAQTLRVKYEDGYEDDVAIQTEEVVWATERPATAAKERTSSGAWRRQDDSAQRKVAAAEAAKAGRTKVNNSSSETIEVPHASARLIIGREGSTVEELERASGARILVLEMRFVLSATQSDRAIGNLCQVGKAASGEMRAIHLVGAARSRAVASTMIHGLISEAKRGEWDVKHAPLVSELFGLLHFALPCRLGF